MIRISFKRDSEGNPTAVRCKGHAGFAKAGKDIVCAAVSVLVINTINSIEEFTDDTFECESNEKDGYIYFSLNDSCSKEALLLMKSLELGIKGVMNDTTKKFISLIDWEV